MTLLTAKRLAALFFCTTLIFAGLFLWRSSAPPRHCPHPLSNR